MVVSWKNIKAFDLTLMKGDEVVEILK